MRKNRLIIFVVLVVGLALLSFGCTDSSRLAAFENKEEVRNQMPYANEQELLNLKERYIVVY